MSGQPHYRVHLFEGGAPVEADRARAITAALLEEAALDRLLVQRFFHYREGKPLPGFAPVKFARAGRGFKLVGFGEEGIALVKTLAPHVASVWGRATHRVVRQNAWEGTCAIEPKPFEIQLAVQRIVVHKKAEQYERFKRDPVAHVSGVIARSFARQREVLGLAQPVPVVRVLDWQGEFGAKLGKGGAAFCGLKHVRFTLPAKLTGLWTLGYLASNGYGLCDANLCNADTVARKREESFHAVGE